MISLKQNSSYRLEQAKKLYSEGNYVASSEICDILTRAGYTSPALLHLKALRLIRIDSLDNAKRLLNRCLQSSPSFGDAWLDLGYIYAKQGHDDQALVAYYKAISIDQRCSAAYNGVAVVYARKGDSKSAADILRRSASCAWVHPSRRRKFRILLPSRNDSAMNYLFCHDVTSLQDNIYKRQAL